MKYQGIIGFVAGAAIGGLATYFFLNKRLEAELKEEIEDVKRTYSKPDLKFETKDTDTYSTSGGYVTSSIASVIPDNMTIIPPPTVTYIPKECLPDEKEIEENKELGMLNPSEDPDFPYLISDDTYVDTKENYSKEILHYYAGDGVIADEELEAIIHPEMLVGDNVAEYFDNLLETEHYADAIYIRNDQISRDFEIMYHEDKFFC